MNTDPLDDLIKAYAQQPLPPPAPFSRAALWREIAARRRQPWRASLFPVLSWREVLAEPRLAIAGLVVALVTGMVPVAAAKNFDKARIARDSLRLDVFTKCHGCAAADMLASHQGR